ncbi:uncharacterized protein EAE97_005807 [Botrytis byssoidea]|uniref:Uncharacterized protein n=1 Tax=Botrytis byssoidea TaxID=139641 RepID=A0A9P5IJH3_9HELO|nr:uncharacterized protein EAE97_005807 [Botrytis byssoidea]KAF7943737.1 hypothetical protein EAE97_005807 [Botrytis byssoidea]
MVELNDIAFNIAASINGLFVLEIDINKFMDDTAITAARSNVSLVLRCSHLARNGKKWVRMSISIAEQKSNKNNT